MLFSTQPMYMRSASYDTCLVHDARSSVLDPMMSPVRLLRLQFISGIKKGLKESFSHKSIPRQNKN